MINIDDFTDEDIKIQKKSLGTIIKDSNYKSTKLYKQLLYELMKDIITELNNGNITKESYLILLDNYNGSFNIKVPISTLSQLKYFIRICISCLGPNINLNWLDVSKLNTLNKLFENSEFDGDISEWDVSHVKDMSWMFCNSKFTARNGSLENWNVSRVNNMSCMFCSCYLFNDNLSKWNVKHVTDMSSMFEVTCIFNSDISNWDVSNVINMEYMFLLANGFNQDISSWDVSYCENFNNMFSFAHEFNLDLSKWNISYDATTNGMFSRNYNIAYLPKLYLKNIKKGTK